MQYQIRVLEYTWICMGLESVSLLFTKCTIKRLQTNFSRTFDRIGKSDKGRKSLTEEAFLTFGMGLMVALFKQRGTWATLTDQLKWQLLQNFTY